MDDKKQNLENFIDTVHNLSINGKKFSMETLTSAYGITNNAAWILTKLGILETPSKGFYKWKTNGKTTSDIADEFAQFRNNTMQKTKLKKVLDSSQLIEMLSDIQAKVDFIYNEFKK